VPPEDARLIADTLVQADLWGHQSHGVLRLGWYLERIRNGVMLLTSNGGPAMAPWGGRK
jgi:LDH2 family malate/lactate/ureidoglycolate dehydrogenase